MTTATVGEERPRARSSPSGGAGASVIELEGLRKEYRSRRGRTIAVDGLDLAVPAGGVYGFLGPNGSGKTTTIRCLLGLVRPSAGNVRLLGSSVPAGLPEAVRRVGAVIETQSLFPTMSGRENLRLLAGIDRIGRARIDAVLEEVGLADRAGELVRAYSLGMRQRLGLAAALLKDPALLILDEPANGLDPSGIRQVRHLLRRLGAEGRTVFVSSHLLSEVEQTCDRVAIMSRGRCIVHGTVDSVLREAGTDALRVRVDDLDAGRQALARRGIPVERVDGHLRVGLPAEAGSRVSQVLAEERIWVCELRPEERSLEDLFLELTGEDAGGDPAEPGPESGDAEVQATWAS